MEPIKAGDQCKVIDGTLKSKSPNVGKTVAVVSIQGDHSRLGRIWRCTGESLEQFDGSIDTWADFPAVWLKKMPKAKGKDASKALERTNG